MLGIKRGFLDYFFSKITAVNSALALKADLTTVNSALALKADLTTVNSALALKANLLSPALTGTPTTTTAAAATNTTQIASTAFVKTIAGGISTPAISKAANGYMLLANGMIFQWGRKIAVEFSGAGVAVIFPIAFPSSVCSLSVTLSSTTMDVAGATGGGGKYNSGTLSLSGVTIGTDEYLGTGTGNLDWFAIGY